MENYILSLKGKAIQTPLVMAILNMTPDSFYESCRTLTEAELIRSAEKAICDGADILDIGGYSTRPGAPVVTEEEELRRVSIAAECLYRNFPDAILSVDTFRSRVAAHVVENYDVSIVNDISGGTLDDKMFETVGKLGVAYVLMHMRGTPQTMSNFTNYNCLVSEIMDFFQARVASLKQAGVKDIILDPGFGFAKTLDQNYELLQKMSYFRALNLPILAGISRKSMIYKLLETTPQHALNGTTVLNTIALERGAQILRVHDVKEAVEALKIVEKLHN